jgi:hypothetical protein
MHDVSFLRFQSLPNPYHANDFVFEFEEFDQLPLNPQGLVHFLDKWQLIQPI